MKNAGILLLTAIIWGFAFVAQSVGMDYVGPFTFNCVRLFIGALVLLPCIALLDKLNGTDTGKQGEKKHKTGREEWIGGICCGIALATASIRRWERLDLLPPAIFYWFRYLGSFSTKNVESLCGLVSFWQ